MTTHTSAASPALGTTSATGSKLYEEGIAAGTLGAVTVAVWFLLLDTMAGRPLYTPTVLGTALFRGAEGLATPENLPVSIEMALMFTWVHFLVFALIGGAAALLLGLAEKDPNYGFGILLLFVIFEFGFLVAAMIFASDVLHALAWPAILVGNLLAAGAMARYFWRRHPTLTIWP